MKREPLRVLLALLVWALAAPVVRADGAPAVSTWVTPTHSAALPATTLEDVVGKRVMLPPVQGKFTVLHFWATWCVPCIAELPALGWLAAELAPRGVMVLAVSEDRGSRSEVAPFLARRPLPPGPLAVLLDPHRSLARELAVSVVPTTIVYDSGGRERIRLVGSGSWTGADKEKLLAAMADPHVP